MEQLFKDLKVDGTPITDFELLMSDDNDNIRLYVKRGEHSYRSVILEFAGCELTKGSHWNDTTRCDTMFQIDALWDGTRHLWCHNGDEDDSGDTGYLYYPSMPTLIKMLQRLQELSKELGIEEE